MFSSYQTFIFVVFVKVLFSLAFMANAGYDALPSKKPRYGYFTFFGLKNAIGVRKIILDVVFVVDFIFSVEIFSFFSETEFLRVVDFGCKIQLKTRF